MIQALKIIALSGIILLIPSVYADAQDGRNWDNQIYLGNKVAFGKDKWKFSGELQMRLENNFQNLDNWYFEFVSNYLISEHFEIVPDFRFTKEWGLLCGLILLAGMCLEIVNYSKN